MAVTPEPGTMAGTRREVVAPEQKPGGLGRGHRTLEPAPERRAGGRPRGAVVPRSACACVEPGPVPGPVFPSVPQGRLLPFCPAGPSLPRALPSIRFSTERCPGTRPTPSSVTLRCSSPNPQVSLTWPSLHVAMPVLGDTQVLSTFCWWCSWVAPVLPQGRGISECWSRCPRSPSCLHWDRSHPCSSPDPRAMFSLLRQLLPAPALPGQTADVGDRRPPSVLRQQCDSFIQGWVDARPLRARPRSGRGLECGVRGGQGGSPPSRHCTSAARCAGGHLTLEARGPVRCRIRRDDRSGPWAPGVARATGGTVLSDRGERPVFWRRRPRAAVSKETFRLLSMCVHVFCSSIKTSGMLSPRTARCWRGRRGGQNSPSTSPSSAA